MKKCSFPIKQGFTFVLLLFCKIAVPQTVPVTFWVDANNTQYHTVQLWNWPDMHDLTDKNGDRIFETTVELGPGTYYYHILRDGTYGCDPNNPKMEAPYPTRGSYLDVSDPMITYLLPKDKDMMRKKRIRADFAFSPQNPPEENSIAVIINDQSISDASGYYNTTTQVLEMPNPPHLKEGTNQVVVSYQTNKGPVSRTSIFTYKPIKLMTDTIIYRMDTVLAWGRVFEKPYPASVALGCNGKTYNAQVNSEGYFGVPVALQSGNNTLQVANSEANLSSPIDEMVLKAELAASWWVELRADIEGTTATINTHPHGVEEENLTYHWSEAENPEGLNISGNSAAVNFDLPTTPGTYIIQLSAEDISGNSYTARKMLIVTEDQAHFLGIHDRAPWMEEMVIYNTLHNYFDSFTFQKLESIFEHMQHMGMNTLRITPFVLGGFLSYDHFELFPEYGSKEDLKTMIETAHAYDIKVLFDIPLSHVGAYHPFIEPDFLLNEAAEPYANFVMWEGKPGESDIIYSPDNGRGCVYTDLDNPYTAEYFYKLIEYWVEEFDVDGYRFDCGQESLRRSPEFSTLVLKRLRNIKPDFFILNEGENRQHPDVDYYKFGDAAYDWDLNSPWGGGQTGLPGMFQETYTVDELHNLLTSGTPDSGLVMRYANSEYHYEYQNRLEYLHDTYGWEQERTAFAIVSTAYGLPCVYQGEEVGGNRINGTFDLSDPLKISPFYQRLIKVRQHLLGNYPEILRLQVTNSNEIYAYTSNKDTNMVLTVTNFTPQQNSVTINLQDPAFKGEKINAWYDIINDAYENFTTENSKTITLKAWETKVLAINLHASEIFPKTKHITISSLTDKYEITQDKGLLKLLATFSPGYTLDSIQWEITGDTHLGTLSNGTLKACGCGEGTVTVTARSTNNPQVYANCDILISNQTSGQVSNSHFTHDVENWSLWTPECNDTLVWNQGEAMVNLGENPPNCYAQLMSTDYMTVEQDQWYQVKFDAYASVATKLYCKIRENGNNYADLSEEPEFDLYTTKQTYQFRFKATEATSHIAQIHFNFKGSNQNIAIDNVSFCSSEPEVVKVPVTFRVDMQNETVTNEEVGITGSWDNWQQLTPLTTNDNIYETTLELSQGASLEYQYVNGSSLTNAESYEEIDGDCANANGNRHLTVPAEQTTLDVVCFGLCTSCPTETDISGFSPSTFKLYPNPAKGKVYIQLMGINKATAKIINLLGTKQLEQRLQKESTSINLNNMQEGIYFLVIEHNDTKYTSKLIIAR